MESVSIPGSVTAIGIYAFGNCPMLASVYCNATEPPVIDFETFITTHYENSILYIPIGTKDKYASAANWSNFVNINEHDFSGIETIFNDKVEVSVENGEIIVNGAQNIAVYSTDGKQIYRGDSANIPVAKGVYIVIADGKTFKVAL